MVLGGLKMQIDVGYFYFIKDSFFDIIDDSELMKNKENGNKRPCYYCIKSKKYDNIIWFIPVSTKIDKYKRIYDSKIQKQIKLGKNPSIDTIVFGDVANTYSAFLIQNMFPVTLDYIESQYMKNKVPIKVSKQLETEINNVKILMKSFESQAQCIHDHKQHLATIYQLIYDEKYDQAENFIKSIQGGIYVALYRIRTNHAIIDAILNQKFLQAENNNIVLDIRAGDLSAIQIPDSLLVTIISNPIDNAIEACSIVSVKKIVTIKIVIEEGILIFSVINPIAKPVKIINNQIETTKADKSIHGMGLKNVALALSKCNGDYEIICNENSFQFTALIRL